MKENVTSNVLEKLREQKKGLEERIKREEARENDKIKKARTKRLIELGATVESVLGRPITQDELPLVKKFLMSQEERGKFFSNALEKKDTTNELI